MRRSKLCGQADAVPASGRSPSTTPAGPLFEGLDERLCMAVVVWDGGPTGNGTNWADPVNWAGDVMPGMFDDAQLVATGTNPLITMVGNLTIRGLTSARSAELVAGTVTLNANSVFDAGTTFTLAGGRIAGTGDFMVNGAMEWIAGAMQGTGRMLVAAGATLSIAPFFGSEAFLRRNLEIDGTATLFEGGIDPGVEITIQNDGVFEAVTASHIDAASIGHSYHFVNNGTFTKTGASLLYLGGAEFVNNGVMTIEAGTVRTAPLDVAGAVINHGVLNLGASAVLVTPYFTQSATGSLSTEFSGPGEFGRIQSTNAVVLDGSLTVTTTGGYTPTLFDRFDVISQPFSMTGGFAGVTLPESKDALRKWITVYHADRVEIVYTSAADWNEDGLVNSTDVSDFINDWFVDQAKGGFLTDFNDDGVSNSTDVSDFINLWFEDQ